MAQDPEHDDERQDAEAAGGSDDDFVPLYHSQTIEAESEAEVIRGILDANGIPATLTGSIMAPLGSQIRVPKGRLEEAQRLIAEQQAAGPEAAAEAEAASEER
jgi:hypothetical protein